MRNLLSKLRTPSGIIVVSIILGLGLASIFRRTCVGDNCRVFKGQSVNKLDGKVFKKNGKCYTMKPQTVTCDANKKLFEFEHE